MSETTHDEPPLRTLLAALVEGDRWMTAEAAAFFLGELPLATFYQHAARPDFPRPVKLGKGRKWKRSALAEWMDKEHARQNRAA